MANIGAPSDVTIFDANTKSTYDVNQSYSNSRNSPYRAIASERSHNTIVAQRHNRVTIVDSARSKQAQPGLLLKNPNAYSIESSADPARW